MKRKLCAIALVVCTMSAMSCSVVFQDSVRSSSVYCSTSRFWYLTDFVLTGTYLYAMSRADPPPVGYAPAAVFGASGLIGIYKRHNCVNYRASAPPEVWAAAAEGARQQAAADAAAAAQRQAEFEQQQLANAQQQLENGQQEREIEEEQRQRQPSQPVYRPPPQQPPPVQQPPPSGNVTVTIERHAATDELGKQCTSQPGWPQAGGCQYGAVCYARQCTVWCSNDGSCPTGYRCALTDENPRTKLCRR